MRLNLKDEPLLDETMELPSFFSSSYSSGFAGTDSLVSFNSSQLFDDSDDHEVDVDAMDSNSSRGDYALLSMPVESVKHMVPTTSVVTRSSNRTLNATWNSQDCSFGRATAITDALRELREGRVAVEDEETEPVSVTLRQLVTRYLHAVTLTAYAAHLCLSHSSERLLRALREQLLRHLLLDRSQLWFDSNKSVVADFGAELTRDSLIIRQGLGPELGAVCRLSLQFIGGFTVAFMALWDLTLAISCVTPIIVRVITIVRQTRAKTDNEADAVATEALSNMQTVLALNAQRRVREKHALRVRITEKERVLVRGRHAALRATLTGTLWVSSAIGLWYGGKKVYEAEAEPGQVFGTFLGVIIGSHALGHLIPSFAALTRAKHASSELFTVLETPLKPHNNVMNPLPRPASCSGAIMAVDLHFSYPRRPDLQVLRGCNISLLSGECVAIVGDGGAGKSTLLMLLMRLYEPSQGLILLDGREVNALDSTWMRAQYGLVPQHVTLFRASIFDNIAWERVINAAQRADVHDFILSLPDGYNTRVGENGVVKLTAQQRQRIALARALIREPNPQELLSRFGGAVGAGSTTMLLCTSQVRAAAVQYADNIVVLERGKLREQGTHVELLQRGNSFYRRLHLIQHSAVREQYLTEAPAPIQQQQETRAALTSPTKLTKRDIKALSRPERQFLAFGLAASVIVGLGGPLLGVLISEMAADMVQQYSTYLESYDAVRLVQTLRPLVMRHGIFLGAGAAVIVVFQSVQLFCLDAAAERVASHLRDLHFSSLLAQPLAFFDQYNTKELVESLATQASTASLAVGRAQGYKLQIFCTLTTTFVLAFWSGSWMLTLVLLAALPLLLIGYSIHNQQRLRAPTTLGATEEAVEIHVNEALRNRRAVVILGLENSWCSSFDVLLQRPLQSIRRKARLEAVGKGFSAVVAVAACALSCWLGGVLEHYGDATFQELMRSLVVVIVSAESLGLAVAWLTRIDRALQAGANIFAIRDAAIVASGANEASTSDGERDPMPQSPMLRGSITFQNVCFAYSSRPSSRVLNGLSLHVAAGQTVALCGPRGAGMSTIFSLIEGFYDLLSASGNSGRVMLDGADMRALEVSWLRAQVSFVGSEPTLFLGTIAENIAYGMAAPPTLEMIVSASEVAHAHAFISRLPEGYATRVGGQLQLSPSQRQRIALARTVLEDARLLLLDEPTRSLGAESEKIAVQQALDTIVAQRVRRTTVIAAHPSESVTVRNADLIYVIQDGRVVNQGTHSELFQIQDGVYARLLQASTWSVASSNSYTVSLNTT
ncbi:P-loop containing nucleoside triphosphate hydrolase [Phytophthora cactorum]|nr:P-loop containing nucleoside triphosphate hydrolase [Phytophthora cactorum]